MKGGARKCANYANTHREGNKTRHETTKREHIRDKYNDRRHTHTHTQIEETNLIVRLEHTGGPGEQLRPRKHTN